MRATDAAQITALLKAWSSGDENALDHLTAVVYRELRRMASAHMRRERPGHTLQTTALVNEVYLRLVDVKSVDLRHRSQFFGLAATLMRRILVDAAREHRARKRGGHVEKIDLQAATISQEPDTFMVDLDQALETLSKVAPRQAKVVELRYFGGVSDEDAAELLGTSARTVRRDWQFARAWLMQQMETSRS